MRGVKRNVKRGECRLTSCDRRMIRIGTDTFSELRMPIFDWRMIGSMPIRSTRAIRVPFPTVSRQVAQGTDVHGFGKKSGQQVSTDIRKLIDYEVRRIRPFSYTASSTLCPRSSSFPPIHLLNGWTTDERKSARTGILPARLIFSSPSSGKRRFSFSNTPVVCTR